jgi:DNA topoisomerase-1
VVDGLVRSKLDFMDPGFTAQMEEELDEVGTGSLKRVQLLKRFYKRFREQLDLSKKQKPWKPDTEKTDVKCDECGAMMLKKWGRNGYFLSCERYPECKGTRDLAADGAPAQVKETDISCDKCGKPMVIKNGRFGEFLSCTGYPGCKNARPVPLGVACPQCGGDLIEVRPRKRGGRTFYGCSNYAAEQKCEFKLWQKPVSVPCPVCGAPFMTRSAGKKPMLVCAKKECAHKIELDENGEVPAASGSNGESTAEAAAPPPTDTAKPSSKSAKAGASKGRSRSGKAAHS